MVPWIFNSSNCFVLGSIRRSLGRAARDEGFLRATVFGSVFANSPLETSADPSLQG